MTAHLDMVFAALADPTRRAVFAVLCPRRGVALDSAGVMAAIAGSLAKFKQPKAAVVLADLPRNTMGKVQKNLLRAEYADWFKA